MRLLIFTFVIAVMALVFAIWPVVADAPWEDEKATADSPRCQAALMLRNDLILQGPQRYPGETRTQPYDGYNATLRQARAEIARYCERP